MHRPLVALALLALSFAPGCGDEAAEPGSGGPRPDTLEEWRRQRAERDQRVWADERLAGEYEQSFVAVWDELLRADRDGEPEAKLAAFSRISFDEIRLGSLQAPEPLDHGIALRALGEPTRSLGPAEWAAWLQGLWQEGYRLVQSDFHHSRFEPSRDGRPARSAVAVAFHLLDPPRERRLAVEGTLGVEWSGSRDARGNPVPSRIDATGLRVQERAGAPPFERILGFDWKQGRRRSRLHPVLVYDLDGDGLSEIALVGANRVLWNLGGGRFRDEALVAQANSFGETAVLADLDGDSHPDLLAPRVQGDLALYRGDAQGRFPDAPQIGPAFEEPLRGPSALSVGDVDADGDLDVWLAQYEPAYVGGQMPSPFYDANDGFPSHLLRNDGAGTFTPATEAAGLAEKRFRRTYASSFVDLDEDGDLDLVVVADYAGIDLYHNDGSGRFSDANHTIRGDRHLFGMSVSFSDYDGDGRLDFWAAGMASTTARRLEALGLGREDRPDVQAMRMRMAFGNRMYLARDDGWREPDFSEEVARTGWTWGTTAFDLDNDGDRDLFAANGHASGESTEDYCSNFWTHDIYDGRSEPDPALDALFAEEGAGLASGRESWDGHQKNQLLMNRDGKGFTNVAWLLGVGDAFDSRSALSDDLDGDGRVDLVVTEDHGVDGEVLHVYRNALEAPGGWIGVRLREEGGGVSPVGASVVVRTPERLHVAKLVTGDSLMGQHPTTVHFGLGDSTRVESIEVTWIGGQRQVLRDPEPGRTHAVAPPVSTDTRTASGRR